MKFKFLKSISVCSIGLLCSMASEAQKKEAVKFAKEKDQTTIDVLIGNKLFTRFIYPDSLAKPVLYPIFAANGTMVTRGFPILPLPGEPNDHPHHLGLWFNFENVNGLDFWNNSYAIPAEKKRLYGWIKTDQVLKTKDGPKGLLTYHANWTNMQNEVLLEETTQYEFSGTESERVIDRITLLKAKVDVVFADAKDGLLGLRAAHELQIPDLKDKLYTDDKGVATIVKGSDDHIANGNYLTSEGKTGDSAWSTRGVWCKMFGKMKDDSISIAIIDHPENVNYPTFWHARGYGLFAANPLGEKVFTNGKSAKNLRLKEGETVRFMYRIVIDAGKTTPTAEQLNQQASDFAKEKPGDITK